MNEETHDQQPLPPADQRRDLRSPLIVQKVKVDDGRTCFFGYAKNISRSGMFIASTNPRQPGERFEVELPLPAPLRRTVRCACEVVWQRQYSKKSPYEPGMGLRFVDLPEEAAAAIAAWVGEQSE